MCPVYLVWLLSLHAVKCWVSAKTDTSVMSLFCLPQSQRRWPLTPSQPIKDLSSQTTVPLWPTGIYIHSHCRILRAALMWKCLFWAQRASLRAFITGRWWCRRRPSGWSAWPMRRSVAKVASRSSPAAASTALLCMTETSTVPAPSPGPVSMSRPSWRK